MDYDLSESERLDGATANTFPGVWGRSGFHFCFMSCALFEGKVSAPLPVLRVEPKAKSSTSSAQKIGVEQRVVGVKI
jgi:hypothetical protein